MPNDSFLRSLGFRLTCLLGVTLASTTPAVEASFRQTAWAESLLQTREMLSQESRPEQQRAEAAARAWLRLREDFPVESDWAWQDGGQHFRQWFSSTNGMSPAETMVRKVVAELAEADRELARQLGRETRLAEASREQRLLALYVQACEQRRRQRLRTVLAKAPRIIFTKRRTLRPSFFAYTEGQSDAQNERQFLPGSELCLLEFDGPYGRVSTLLRAPGGAIRDPAVSWDGSRVAFAWKKSLHEDDYHLYELNVVTEQVRQLTSGLGFADYEPAYLPNGDLIFASTRCVQTVDCWWTEVSNLYTCDTDGRYLRRLGFDQVHTVYPQVLDDGRVVYTRWDYNDRGQIFPQPLFQMYPDGTGQTEYYGNSSWFPTTIAHARGIPGTTKVLAILCGHHSSQAGKLAVIDPSLGRQENSGVQLVSPVRDTPAERIDSYGQVGELWQYPYPLTEREYLVTFAPLGWDHPERRRGDADFAIYWMDIDGHRELLAWDAELPCNQPVPLASRPRPPARASQVDYRRETGAYHVQDVYSGPGLAGVPRGTVTKLRVVALDFRPAGVGQNGSHGPGGGALVSTPISIGNGAWDVKTVLGEARVYEDGSAFFSVPARTPVYFQAVDSRGCVVQTMRSWSTLQPGEHFGCAGCHDSKNMAPPMGHAGVTQAMKAGCQPLEPFYGPPRGFSFAREIQPILDRHCIRCHQDRTPIEQLIRGESRKPVLTRLPTEQPSGASEDTLAFSLLSDMSTDHTAKRRWSDAYLVLTQSLPDQTDSDAQAFRGNCGGRVVNWISSQSVPEPFPPYSAGAARSELLTLLEQGHQGVRLAREELDKVACWIDLLVPFCGDYQESNAWNEAEEKKFDHFATKRRLMEEIEQANLSQLLESREAVPARQAPGKTRPR